MTREEAINILKQVISWRHDNLRGHPEIKYVAEAIEIIMSSLPSIPSNLAEAPDKIYLGIRPMSGDEPNKRYLYVEWHEEPKPSLENIKYIRKDTLLEWAYEDLGQMAYQELKDFLDVI